MKGELYLRVQLGLPHSDGARILERHLSDKRAWAYTHQMWDWFARKHQDGQVTGPDAAYLIARGAGWEGDHDKFCSAQVLAGFLAVITEGFRVKGWKEWAGYYFTVSARERDKKANQRKGKSLGSSRACPRDVPGTDEGQVGLEAPSGGTCPGDPSYISSLSVSSASEGVQGEARRPRLVSPFGSADPYPATTAVLAALYERGIDAAPPAEKSAPRVEAAVVAVTVAVAVERLLPIYADPSARKPLTYHVAAIRSDARKPSNTGDLGCDLIPWYQRLTDDEVRAYRQERRTIAPDLDDAPIGITGPEHELADLNAKWRMVAEERA